MTGDLAAAYDALRDALHAMAQHACATCRDAIKRHAETYQRAKDAVRAPGAPLVADAEPGGREAREEGQ